ncbi:hypothetical protein Ahy_B01g052735 [Arachis hypogaea]|uniref:Uncharacterized protein n=1 Tax=Arachis hypogaea TaxID=3818 RepID=A0A445AQE1_ARAHY|nr:hypothetical protein Ahy_B01g052735 [Arachis hypogaea]
MLDVHARLMPQYMMEWYAIVHDVIGGGGLSSSSLQVVPLDVRLIHLVQPRDIEEDDSKGDSDYVAETRSLNDFFLCWIYAGDSHWRGFSVSPASPHYHTLNSDTMHLDDPFNTGQEEDHNTDDGLEFWAGHRFENRDIVLMVSTKLWSWIDLNTIVIASNSPTIRLSMENVRKFGGPHACLAPTMSQDHTLLDNSLICKNDPSVSILVLQSVVHQSYHFKPSYRKKAIAQIYGDWEEWYNKKLSLLQALQECFPVLQAFCIGRWDILIRKVQGCAVNYWLKMVACYSATGTSRISDRSQAIRATQNTPHSGWHPPLAHHAYYIRHMALYFNSRFKSAEGERYLINASHTPSKEGCDWYLDALSGLSRDMLDWALRFSKDLWLQHCDKGRRVHKCSAKGNEELPIVAIVWETLERLQQLFMRKDCEAQAQLQDG